MKGKYYKVLHEDGTPFWGGVGRWHLPHNGKPGKGLPEIKGPLKPCQNGYHVLTAGQLVRWLGPAIFEVQVSKEIVVHPDKCVVRSARLLRRCRRWNDRTARLFAADCAEHVLPIFESQYPNDQRPRLAIQAARDYANGKIGGEARAAAWVAALAAAEAAGGDAAWTAAWTAGGDAAWTAAWTAARDAGGDAAWTAAEAAAEAEAAVRAAAEDAAWTAARDAECGWQTKRLFRYLDGRMGR